jgi:hypothetical protein
MRDGRHTRGAALIRSPAGKMPENSKHTGDLGMHFRMKTVVAVGTMLALSAPAWAQTATATGSATGQANLGATAMVAPLDANLGLGVAATGGLTDPTVGNVAVTGSGSVGAAASGGANASVSVGASGASSGQASSGATGSASAEGQGCLSADAALGVDTGGQAGGNCQP